MISNQRPCASLRDSFSSCSCCFSITATLSAARRRSSASFISKLAKLACLGRAPTARSTLWRAGVRSSVMASLQGGVVGATWGVGSLVSSDTSMMSWAALALAFADRTVLFRHATCFAFHCLMAARSNGGFLSRSLARDLELSLKC